MHKRVLVLSQTGVLSHMYAHKCTTQKFKGPSPNYPRTLQPSALKPSTHGRVLRP